LVYLDWVTDFNALGDSDHVAIDFSQFYVVPVAGDLFAVFLFHDEEGVALRWVFFFRS